MDDLWQQPRRLHSRGANCHGLVIDMDGVALGASCELVGKTSLGYRALGADELSKRFRNIPEIQDDYGYIARSLSAIARALDTKDLLHAQLLGLQLPFAVDIYPRGSCETDLFKANYDAAEARNASGEWTAAFEAIGGLVSSLSSASLALAEEATIDVGISTLAGGTVGLLAGIVYPSGNWLTYQGALPDHPEIDYRYDEGDLSLYRTASNNKPTLIYQGRADQDGFYRDDQGNIIARDLGHGFQIYTNSIVTPTATVTNARSQARVVADTDEPQVCPDPGPDEPHGASPRAIAYQWQITGLEPGLAVMLNGLIFDGCHPVTGNMLEAKGEAYASLLSINEAIRDKILGKWAETAKEQSQKAAGRIVEWHFAEEAAANLARERLERIPNVVVIYTPPIIKLSPIGKAKFHELYHGALRIRH